MRGTYTLWRRFRSWYIRRKGLLLEVPSDIIEVLERSYITIALRPYAVDLEMIEDSDNKACAYDPIDRKKIINNDIN